MRLESREFSVVVIDVVDIDRVGLVFIDDVALVVAKGVIVAAAE